MCTLFSSIKAFVKTIALRARANIIFHTTEIKSQFMTQRSTVDKYFKPRNSNNSRLVFICINSYINPCVIFWHRSDLRNGVGWSLLPTIWLTINAVKEKLAISGKTDETHERVQENRWAGPGGSRSRVYMHIISVTEFTSPPYHTPINVGRLYLTLCIQYTVCVPTSHGDSSW